jgi:hypothetical protein
MEYWSDGRTTESAERKFPKETKITEKVARVRKNYWCEMVQITAKWCKLPRNGANWCKKTAVAYGRVGNFDFRLGRGSLLDTNSHEFSRILSRIFVVCGPWRSNEAAGFGMGREMQKPAKTCKNLQTGREVT